MESYEKETSLKKEHVGALCSVVVIGNKVENFKKEKVSPFHVTCDGENEHLGKSGALGMCDDPYCTICPTYFKAYQQRLGLLLFALLIGNIQNFLQGLGRRRLEMLLRSRDVEQWMRHRRLPENLKRFGIKCYS
ncbi:hypothetical protein P8452_55835 [Trifolium repens]|nr:hypothetical protein P8452_55835 [Trifolium repens]